METKTKAVFGIFQDVSRLERAAMTLRDAEYRNTAVSVLFPDKPRTRGSALEEQTGASKGLIVGTRIGAVVGGVFGWLTGTGELTIPGLESFTASRAIVAVVAGVGAGSVVGGFLGALVQLGNQLYGGRHNLESRKTGGFLLSVHCRDRDLAQRAEMIMKNTGADAVSFSGSAAA
jgi:hypothetical protein